MVEGECLNRITGILGTDKEAQYVSQMYLRCISDVPRASSKCNTSQESEVRSKTLFLINQKIGKNRDRPLGKSFGEMIVQFTPENENALLYKGRVREG
jgi:hypothetical protein